MADSTNRKRPDEVNGPSYRDVYGEIREATWEFKDALVAKYKDYHGRDYRKEISHLLEQAGLGLHSDLEQAKQAKRDRLRAINGAR